MKKIIEQIQAEYERCLEFVTHPEESPKLYGISNRLDIIEYYSHKAEGLGFALDRLNKIYQPPNTRRLLRYQCRMCGEEYIDGYTTGNAVALTALSNPMLLMKHEHQDGSIGVADLIGVGAEEQI